MPVARFPLCLPVRSPVAVWVRRTLPVACRAGAACR